MTRPLHRRVGLATVAGTLIACVAITGTASAGAYWQAPVVIRNAINVELEDLAAAGTGIAVGWSEGDLLWVRSSDDRGAVFDPRFRVVDDPAKAARDLSLDIGAASVWAAWAEDRRDGAHPDRWRVMIGQRDIGGGALSAGQAVANQRHARNVDLGFGGGRVWIAFQEPPAASPTSEIRVWSSLTDAIGVSTTLNTIGDAPLGQGTAQLSAVPSRGYVAWANGGIRFKSANVGGAPGYPVAWNATRLLSPTGTHPIMGAGGNLVMVAWTHGGDLWIRISDDRGATWAAARRLADGSFPSEVWRPTDLDIASDRVVLMAVAEGDDGNATERFQSFNGGAAWGGPIFVKLFDVRLADFFAGEGGVTKLCEAWADEFTGPDPKALRWRRQD